MVLKTNIGLNVSLISKLKENLPSDGSWRKLILWSRWVLYIVETVSFWVITGIGYCGWWVLYIVETVLAYNKLFPKDINAFIGLSGGLLTLLFNTKSSGNIYLKSP